MFKSHFDRKNFLIALGGILILLLIFQNIRINSALKQIASKDSKPFQQWIMEQGEDMNELRDYLLLPRKEYKWGMEEQNKEEKNDDLTSAVYRFADKTGSDYQSEKRKEENTAFIRKLKNGGDFQNGLKELGLSSSRTVEETKDDLALKIYEEKEPIIQIVVDKNTEEISFLSVRGKDTLQMEEGQTLEKGVLDYLQNGKEKIKTVKEKIEEQKTALDALWNDEDMGTVLNEKQFQITLHPIETEEGFQYTFQNADTEPLLTITLERKEGNLKMENKTYASTGELKEELIKTLKKLPAQTSHSKFIKAQEERLKAITQEPGFLEGLKINHFTLKVTEKEGAIYYDFISTEDEVKVSRVILDKITGDIQFQKDEKGVLTPVEDFFQ